MNQIMVGGFYNPHLGAELVEAAGTFDHLAMADPPSSTDPYWPVIKERYTLLLHDYLGQLSEPLAPEAVKRARDLAALYDTPWVAEHFQCLHTQDGSYNLNYVFPPLYTQEFLDRFTANALALAEKLDQPLVMENIPGFFNVEVDQMPEPEWLTRFFDTTRLGFLLDLPHIWIEAHYQDRSPEKFLEAFPLEHVVEIHVAGVEEDADLGGPWISPAPPPEEMFAFAEHALALCPETKAITFDAFSPTLKAEVMFDTIDRIKRLVA